MSTRVRVMAPLLVAAAGVAVFAPPGTAWAGAVEAHSHTSVAVSATVSPGDTAWSLAARLCGQGGLHSRLLIRSPGGTVRADHDRIWPGDRVSGSCLDGPAASPRPRSAANAGGVRGWVAPLASYTLTSCYGMRWGRMHEGLDMVRPWGTPIRSAAAGRVMAAGWIHRGYGISVMLDHGGGVKTHYGHMSRHAVRAGQTVRAGAVIGYVGNTGHVVSQHTGPHAGSHLHFEVRVGAGAWPRSTRNPAPWLRARGVPIRGC